MSLILGKYEQITDIGHGAFGRVILARHQNQQFAIKIINIAKSPKVRPYVQDEIKCLKSIKSKYVMGLVEHAEVNDQIIMVCEYCNKGNLMKYQMEELEDRVFTLQKTFEIISQVLKGLQEIHKQGYLHRDLKLDNILIHEENGMETYKIADCGFSKKQENVHGTVLGTHHFMAPQIHTHHPYGYGVDIWAIGVIVYYMLNQELPFYPPGTQIAYEYFQTQCPFSYKDKVKKSMKRMVNNCTANMESFFKKVFEFNPAKRMNFHEMRHTPYLRKYFTEDIELATSSIIYRTQFTGKALDPMDLVVAIVNHKFNSQAKDIVQEDFPKETDAIQNQIQFHTFLINMSRYFEGQSGFLPKQVIWAIKYNLLKYDIMWVRNIRNGLQEQTLPEELDPKLAWDRFHGTNLYLDYLQRLTLELEYTQKKFQDAYDKCTQNFKRICDIAPQFRQSFRMNPKQTNYEQFKTGFRSVTVFANKILAEQQKQLRSRGVQISRQFLELRIKVVICHMLNRVFSKEHIASNFQVYLQWKATNCSSHGTKFDFVVFEQWVKKQQYKLLVKTFRTILKKYFS